MHGVRQWWMGTFVFAGRVNRLQVAMLSAPLGPDARTKQLSMTIHVCPPDGQELSLLRIIRVWWCAVLCCVPVQLRPPAGRGLSQSP
jgi:hypothetical protein